MSPANGGCEDAQAQNDPLNLDAQNLDTQLDFCIGVLASVWCGIRK
jgi:hypothetical protein